ncbi:MAG: hypothetical protein ACOYB2_10935 [Limnohabitans sp.]
MAVEMKPAWTIRCETCHVLADPDTRKIAHVDVDPMPDDEQIEEWVMDSVCEATDGCSVEPDGRCEHGHPSWLLRLGLV